MITSITSTGSPNSIAPGTTVTGLSETGSSNFQDILQSMLNPDQQGKVNEEQMFAAIINERLMTHVNEKAAEKYRELFAEYKVELQQNNGYIPVETAAEEALRGVADKGFISREQADDFYSEAFSAAQIDANHQFLYDSIGSTVAVTLVDLAIESAEKRVEAIDAGTILPDSTLAATGNETGIDTPGRAFVGGNGFLYKPVSENDGKLVILLPSEMKGGGNSIELQDNNGNVIDQGVWYGDYEDGRPIFRFSKTGADYPDNLTVRVKFGSELTKEYYIPDTSERWA